MPTMIVKQEIEATPTLILAALAKFTEATAELQFPYPRGRAIYLKPEYLKGIGGVEGMPAMVIAAPNGTMLGLIAVYKQTGEITLTFITKDQVIED